MSAFALIVRVDALRSVAFGSITGAFTPLGSIFGHVMRIVKIANITDADMYISFDGATTNDYIPAGGFVLYDLTTNGVGQLFTFEIGTQVYVKYVSGPSKGSINLTALYGQGQ